MVVAAHVLVGGWVLTRLLGCVRLSCRSFQHSHYLRFARERWRSSASHCRPTGCLQHLGPAMSALRLLMPSLSVLAVRLRILPALLDPIQAASLP